MREPRTNATGIRHRNRGDKPPSSALLPADDSLEKLPKEVLLSAIHNEVAAWQWLYDLVPQHPDIESRCEGYIELRRLAGGMLSTDELHSGVSELITKGRIIRAGSARGEFVRLSAKEKPLIAASILAKFLGSLGQPKSQEDFEAIMLELLYRKRIYQRAQPESLELSRVSDSWMLLSRETREELELFKTESRDTLAVTKAKIDSLAQAERGVKKELSEVIAASRLKIGTHLRDAEIEISAKIKNVASSVDTLAKQTEDRLEALRQAYIAQVALKAPVSFWQEKRDLHERTAKQYRRFLAIVAPLITVFLAFLAWVILPEGEGFSIRAIGLFLGISSLAIWFLRVLVRLWLLDVHLETDARERIVMAKTYLSLLEQGVNATDEERRIIMLALFKRSTTGLTKEEAGPGSILETVGRVVGGGK